MNHTKYDKQAQRQLIDQFSWELKREDDIKICLTFTMVALFLIGSIFLFDGIADWLVGIGV